MSSTGTTIDRSQDLTDGGATTVTGWGPPRNAATRSGGRTVAESPIRWVGDPPVSAISASSRSSDNARWAPRFVPASACTSSTITVCTLRNMSRAADVKIRNSDSGVVIKMSGGWLTSLASVGRRRVTGADPDADARWGLSEPERGPGDAGERCPQVPLDVDRQRLER